MPITSIPCFERANNISINLYGYANHAFPIHISSYIDDGRKHIDLLLLEGREGDGMGGGFDTDEEEEGSICQTIADNRSPHYCVIKDLGRLVASDGGNGKRRTFVCRRCLALRPDLESLRWHEKKCAEDEHYVSVTMPLETEKWLKFRNFQHRMSVSFVIVACFECYTTPLYDHDEPTEGYECRERRMDVCAYSYQRISVDNTYPKEPVYYRGSDPSDTMEHFLADMEKEENEIFQILSKIMPMVVCDEGLKNMEDSNDICYICRDPFMPGEVKVTDHSHVSGKIRGRAHNHCNLQLKEQTFLPVVLQNLSRYDGRLILQAIAKHGAKKVKLIPQTIDTFVSVSVNKCRYLDFSRFLDVPLNDMVESMYTKSGFEPFDFVKQNFPVDSWEKVIHKQYMCRDYLDSPTRLHETTLPDIGAFSDCISSTSVNEAEFQHVQDVWSYFGIQTLEQYLRHFLVVQVLHFADVLQNFRNTMMNDYLLDPLYYYSLPGYSYNCALFRTNVVLELIRDEEMYNTILSGIRGGITVVGSPRIARANVPDLPSFDAEKPVSKILFFDYNSLYPSCMIEFPLPTFGFRYLDQEEIQQFDISEYDKTSPKGYILVLDLEYPEELHDRDDMFPMCPENKTVTTAMLSDHTRNLAERCGITLKDERKLVQTLHSKSEYVVHYLTLKYYMEKGMVITNVHKIIEFNQSPWLQDFIEYTCSRRRDAENEFVGMIHKSVACHVFGKCIENQKKRINVKLCTSYQQLLKLVWKPTFQAIRIFSENCAAIQFYNERVTLSRPVAVGFSILDLSKRKMYEFYHEFLLSEIASRGQLNILSCDTDSWLIHAAGYGDLGDIIWKNRDIFDLSSLPENSRFKDETNRRAPGKMKIQLGDSIITEAVVLSPKCYSILTTKGNKTALKGMLCKLQHERYVDCLQHEESFTGSYRAVRHFGQELYHVSYRRRILSPIETKRYYLSANSSLSYGHYRLDDLM